MTPVGGTTGSINSWSLEFLKPTQEDMCPGNILCDGGFEYPTLESRWELAASDYSTSEIRDDSSEAYDGSYYLYLSATGGTYSASARATTTFTLPEGAEAYLSFYRTSSISAFGSDSANASVYIDSDRIAQNEAWIGEYAYYAYDLSAYADGLEHTLKFSAYASRRYEPLPPPSCATKLDNICIKSTLDSAVVINEFVANHTGDDDAAFVELLADSSGRYPTLSLVEIAGDESDNPGRVRTIFPLNELSSFFLRWTTDMPAGLSTGSMTLLLAEAFTAAVDYDLDTDDDGTLDATPWINLLDSVAVHDGGPGDHVYSNTVLNAVWGGGTCPGGASRFPDGIDTDTTTDWVTNGYDGAGLPDILASPQPGYALNTPDAPNAVTPPNGDGCAVYPSTDVAQDILGGYTLTSDLSIDEAGTVADVNVFLDITHSRDSELIIHLISPTGTTVELISHVGLFYDNFTATVLDDSATIDIGSISSTNAPFTGVYAPIGTLADFNGES